MATQIIFDARKKRILISPPQPGEGTAVFAVDLLTDTWQDYSYFIQAAANHERAGEYALRNRCLRAALANLFAHFDGAVSAMYELLTNRPEGRSSLKQKIFALGDHVHARTDTQLSDINLDLKLLRDIINHPTVEKTTRSPEEASAVLTQVDVYAIEISDLVEAADQINNWLNQVCAAVGYERLIDTKVWSEKIAAEIVKQAKQKPGMKAQTKEV